MVDPTHRFSDRVADYCRYRPGYPGALVDYLRQHCGLSSESAIADVGSGTGLLTQLFLEHGNPVVGIEPNPVMRSAGEHQLAHYGQFTSSGGRAEATGLAADSVDLIVVGQAFHWFKPTTTRLEFERILRPSGWLVLLWNERDLTDPFQQGYEALLQNYAPDYASVRHRRRQTLEQLRPFFAPGPVHQTCFDLVQPRDFEGLQGRLMSCSYAPKTAHLAHEPMIVHLKNLFQQYQRQGRIDFCYQTQVYTGQLHPGPKS
ncbi:MAG: class I SAM-dependent methyltransferase [Cyanobacteria bacterium P01_D01_bin.14]